MNNPMFEVLKSINSQLSNAIHECVMLCAESQSGYDEEYGFYYGSYEFEEYTHGRNRDSWTNAREERLALERKRNPYVRPYGRTVAELSENDREAKRVAWELQHEMALNNALLEELHSLTIMSE